MASSIILSSWHINHRSISGFFCRYIINVLSLESGDSKDKTLIIYRQKKPEMLRWLICQEDKIIEEAIDNDAQNRINLKYGTPAVWKFSHYIDEGRENDFLSLSAKDKALVLFSLPHL